MTMTRRFATLLFSLVLIGGMAQASTIKLLSAGNGFGLSDGAHYVGFAALTIDGKNYSAMCIDSLHEANVGDTWSGLVTSLTDTVALTPIIRAQFDQTLTADVFNPRLGADVVAYYMMLANLGNDSIVTLQHSAWGQFDPRYIVQTLAPSAASILANGFMDNGTGGQTPVSINSFFIVTDSSNVRQAFIVQSTATPTPEPVTLGLLGAGLVLLRLLRRQAR